MNLEQYAHTLIAKPKDFVPSPLQIQEFLSVIQRERVVPGKPTYVLRTLTGKTREYPIIDPLTGKNLVIELRNHRELASLGDIPAAAKAFHDYEIEMAGAGRPKLPPLLIDFKDSYHVGITCFVFSELRSTSDTHDESKIKEITPYLKPCTEAQPTGFFTNPYTLDTIRVPDASCARFWLQFELGKFLAPKIQKDDLNILNPQIVSYAEQTFGIPFVQGCYWG